MTALELLAPARNKDIGIAAIDCGADAVYIAGPAFGARKDAGNPTEDIAPLCEYAHRFGAKIFVTFNIAVRDDELPEMHRQMLAAQEAGADAFIIRDERICSWDDIKVPLHASTQCAIRDPERARRFEALGCRRLILERELSLEQLRGIRAAVNCELEFFVHGALCVCYSGECRLSEYLNGRSADRGECIQACRSLYDLVDADGKVLVKNKALLSLKDFNLRDRIGDLAEAGVCSFKIEGRLKNESYVRNVVRSYSETLDSLVSAYPELYRRASYGHVSGGFRPDLAKTFNRGYTELYLDGKRGKWSSMDAPKSVGEPVGTVAGIKAVRGGIRINVSPMERGIALENGDGFAFLAKSGVVGFRGDVCEGSNILCSGADGLKPGMTLFRNVSAAFEKELAKNACCREIDVTLDVHVHGRFNIDISAASEDGKVAFSPFKADLEVAQNRERAEAVIREGLGKRAGQYSCHVGKFTVDTPGGVLPLLSSAIVNSMRRAVVSDLGYYGCDIPSQRKTIQNSNSVKCPPCGNGTAGVEVLSANGLAGVEVLSADGLATGRHYPQNSLPSGARLSAGKKNSANEPLMRSKYCIRYELGLCPVHQGAKPTGPLFLVNNGRRLALDFDCQACVMNVKKI